MITQASGLQYCKLQNSIVSFLAALILVFLHICEIELSLSIQQVVASHWKLKHLVLWFLGYTTVYHKFLNLFVRENLWAVDSLWRRNKKNLIKTYYCKIFCTGLLSNHFSVIWGSNGGENLRQSVSTVLHQPHPWPSQMQNCNIIREVLHHF